MMGEDEEKNRERRGKRVILAILSPL